MDLDKRSTSAHQNPIALSMRHAGDAVLVAVSADPSGTCATVTLDTASGRLSMFAHEARALADALNRQALTVELEIASD